MGITYENTDDLIRFFARRKFSKKELDLAALNNKTIRLQYNDLLAKAKDENRIDERYTINKRWGVLWI